MVDLEHLWVQRTGGPQLVEEREDLAGGQAELALAGADVALLQAQHDQDGRLAMRQASGEDGARVGF